MPLLPDPTPHITQRESFTAPVPGLGIPTPLRTLPPSTPGKLYGPVGLGPRTSLPWPIFLCTAVKKVKGFRSLQILWHSVLLQNISKPMEQYETPHYASIILVYTHIVAIY